MSLKNILRSVKNLADPKKAQFAQKFFKTGTGEYGEGDVFAGLTSPQSRQIAKQNKDVSFEELSQLIKSKTHEQRFISLVILTLKYKKEKRKCYEFYLEHLDWVNNWDLVDVSCYHIIGAYLLENSQEAGLLKQLALSPNLWRRRISIVSTMAFVKKYQDSHTYEIAQLLLDDKHDLIHKAVGWLLREAGKNDQQRLEQWLIKFYDRLPRTCLRYAIEKFQEDKRQAFLKKAF